MFNKELFLSLAHNIFLLFASVFIISKFYHSFQKKYKRFKVYVLGLGFALVAVLCMMMPIIIRPGLFLDFSSVLIAMAGVFGGVIPAVIASMIACIYRLWIGGSGWPSGLVEIILASITGICYQKAVRFKQVPAFFKNIFFLGFFISFDVIAAILLLPESISLTIFQEDVLVITILYPMVTVFCNFIIRSEFNRIAMGKELEHLAYYDSLTNLPNRLFFTERLHEAIKKASEKKTKLAVIFIDLDNFKKVNDTLGHSSGDELLKELSKKVEACLSDVEMLARLGGDEFVILIENVIQAEDILPLLQKIQNTIESSLIIKGNHLFVSASMGIAIYPDYGTTSEEILQCSDIAMYKAKDLGKNNFQFFRQTMKEAMLKRTNIENSLKDALHNNELVLHYQPQKDASLQKLRGFEALVRWKSREAGLVLPEDFISIAEEAGMIVPIGEWVLRTACQSQRSWKRMYNKDFMISVNISAVQLKEHGFAKAVEGIIAETGIPSSFLELEITESMVIESFEKTKSVLEELANLGVTISLDDFGTGYSSLNYLRSLPIHNVKIDRSFIHEMDQSASEQSIIESIVSLAHKLDLQVIAEGIETDEQLDHLKHCNCDYIQGFLIGSPLPAEEIADIIQDNKAMILK